MSIGLGRIALAVVASCVVGAACVRENDALAASTTTTAAVVTSDDSSFVARLLTVVRGVDPLLCELTTRAVDMHGSWSRWAPMKGGGDPLEVDSAAGALLTWVQEDHTDPSVVPRLRTALGDPDACVRRVAGSLLGRVDHPSATSALVSAVDDVNAQTRFVAALGLGLSENERKKDAAVAPLLRRLKDESAQVRRAAAWSLGSIKARDALTPLLDLLAHDADARVRQAAAWAIGEIDS